MNDNTSATGGYLVAQLPDNVALRRFFQGLIAGVTEIPGNLVRPRWQRNPPPAPDFETTWCAFGITTRDAGESIYVQEDDDGATVNYTERLTILISFYGPECEARAEMLRDEIPIGQNREPLYIAGMGLYSVGNILHVPELVNDQWEDRCDIELIIDRDVSKLYKILSFTGAIGAIITETMTLPFEVVQP